MVPVFGSDAVGLCWCGTFVAGFGASCRRYPYPWTIYTLGYCSSLYYDNMNIMTHNFYNFNLHPISVPSYAPIIATSPPVISLSNVIRKVGCGDGRNYVLNVDAGVGAGGSV